MKGQYTTLTIGLVIAVLFIVVLFSPLTRYTGETVRTTASSYASEIAGALNILQSSPAGTVYTYIPLNLPEKCKISISKHVYVSVNPDKNEQSASRGVVSEMEIQPVVLNCGEFSKIQFRKEVNKIIVSGAK
jgi:hypothetical protein